MRKLALTTAAVLFATVGIASAQTQTQPTTPKNNPAIEKNEKDKNKGNVENQNQQDIKAKEQAPKTNKSH